MKGKKKITSNVAKEKGGKKRVGRHATLSM
jgi:hypothetical protein